jgi:methyltransferase (TIGR00027 family)
VRDETPSFTATWVASMRGLGVFLPERLQLVDDPYGVRFSRVFHRTRRRDGSIAPRALETSRMWFRGPILRFAIYMQLRTRVIDDDVGDFVRAGGRQVVLLGAGFDCRAWRLSALSDATVFEVDHPATQAKKRAVMEGEKPAGRVVYVPWNFERPLSELPARLAREGHDPASPTLTILEGVLMYLTPEATDATFACIHAYAAPGSPAAVSYMDRTMVEERTRQAAARRLIVRLAGEPLRGGWDPSVVPSWLAARGFRLDRDETAGQLGARYLGPAVGRRMQSQRNARSHFALVRRIP